MGGFFVRMVFAIDFLSPELHNCRATGWTGQQVARQSSVASHRAPPRAGRGSTAKWPPERPTSR